MILYECNHRQLFFVWKQKWQKLPLYYNNKNKTDFSLSQRDRLLFFSDRIIVWMQDMFLENISLFRRTRRRGFFALPHRDVIIRLSKRDLLHDSRNGRWRIDYGLSWSAWYLSRCLSRARDGPASVACN